jgi:hypothetical protein
MEHRHHRQRKLERTPPSLECGDMSPLSDDETCLVVQKRGRVRALQSALPRQRKIVFTSDFIRRDYQTIFTRKPQL